MCADITQRGSKITQKNGENNLVFECGAESGAVGVQSSAFWPESRAMIQSCVTLSPDVRQAMIALGDEQSTE